MNDVSAANLRRLVQQYLESLRQLQPYDIQSLADYAEHAFERALNGKRVRRGEKGHDLVVPSLGRVQVKQRHLPASGRIEERLHLRSVTETSCDHVGAVIFNYDCSVRKATLAPINEVWSLMSAHSDPQKKVRFNLLSALPNARDVTELIRSALE